MNKVAKLVIIDNQNNYLVLYRNEHPRFGFDADLPGGTLEEGEVPLEAMLREVIEETGVAIDRTIIVHAYSDTAYSNDEAHYSLYLAKLNERPDVTISWEHSSFEWLSRDDFLKKAKNAQDSYMHMVYDVLKGTAT